MAKENTNRRTGDKIAISGDYQYNAFYHRSPLQRCWHKFRIITAINDLDIKRGMKILDAGCGSGVLSALVAKNNPDVQVTGLDGNADAIAFCRQQWKDLPNLDFKQGLIDEQGQFAAEEMDGIVFLEVIEHITEQQAARVLEEFHRIMKKGGRLVISTPNKKSLWPLLEFIIDLFRLAPGLKHDQHEKLYTGSELEAIARQNGFLPLQKRRINFIAPWLAIFSEKLAMRTHDWEIRQTHVPGSILLYTFTKP